MENIIMENHNASAFVLVNTTTMESSTEKALSNINGVKDIYLLAGNPTYLAKLDAPNNDELGQILREIRSLENIDKLQTLVVLGSIKSPQESKKIEVSEPAADFDMPYKRFLKQLLIRGKNRSRLHDRMRIYERPYMGASSSMVGLKFYYYIGRIWGRVELYIDRLDATENKRIFDQLMQHKSEIEATFGGSLKWERLDEKRACRISKTLHGGYNDEESEWPDLQDQMLATMITLETAIESHLKTAL
jgi:hypothetical protein